MKVYITSCLNIDFPTDLSMLAGCFLRSLGRDTKDTCTRVTVNPMRVFPPEPGVYFVLIRTLRVRLFSSLFMFLLQTFLTRDTDFDANKWGNSK
jgi:hypothetical protein